MNDTHLPNQDQTTKNESRTNDGNSKSNAAQIASRTIISLVCFIASFYIAVVPNALVAALSEFQKGVLTAAFIGMGLVVIASYRQAQPKSKE